jgi:hypothetical protein
MADVKITIDIDADTAAIDRVRAKLNKLCSEVDDCTKTMDAYSSSLKDMSNSQDNNSKSFDRNSKKMGLLGKMAKGLSGFLKKLAKLGFKYMAIEAAAAAVVLLSIGPLFKLGSMLAKGYQNALGGVAFALAAVVAGLAAFAAAQRQFQSVQFAPAFAEGAINTENKFAAASGAMKMFMDDAQLAVIGTKGLTSAFKTLNDQQNVTGKTTAVFRALSNYTAGMGGDLEKGSQSMAKFLAKFQKDKTLTGGVTEAGKELGPEFEKILKEAKKKGLSSYDKFAEAAMNGELGDTFAKYAGQLDAVNSTVIGKFKMAFAGIKSTFTEMGEPLLGPITETIPRIANIIEALLLRIRGNVQEIGQGSLLTGLVDGFDKVAQIIGNLVAGDLGKAGNLITSIKNGWNMTAKIFEKMQDYFRPLQDASWALWQVLKPIFAGFAGNFNNTLQTLADSLVENKDSFIEFGTAIGTFLTAIGSMGLMVKDVIIGLLPTLSDSLRIFSEILTSAQPVFKVLLSLIRPILIVINFILKALLNMAEAIDVVLNPIISVLTLGLGDVKNVVKSLTAAVLLLGAAMAASYLKGGIIKKAVNFVKDPKKMGDLADMSRKGGKNIGKGGKGLIKGIGKFGRGIGNIGTKLAGKIPGVGAGGGGAGVGGTGAAAALAPLAIVAASAYGGSKVGGFVSDKMFNDDSILSKAGGATAGALTGGATGAAIGAGIGSVFGGVGAVPGAVIGAVVGSIFGGISGWIKAGKEKKAARKAADEIMKNYNEGMDKAIKNGDIDALLKSRTKANQELTDLAGSNKYGSKEVKKRRKEIEKLNKQVDTYVSNASNFKLFAGGDADKMNQALADQKFVVDAAKNEILNIFEIMRKGGTDVAASWDTLMGGFNQSLLETRLAMFDTQKNTVLETQKAVDAAQRKLLEGDTSERSVTDFLKKSYEYALLQTGGDATAATALMEETLTYAYGPGGSLSTVANKVLEGANALKLFDPQILVDQMIASGKLNTQGRAIETISNGKIGSGVAEMQIQKLITGAGDKGAAMSAKIDALMRGYMNGQLTEQELIASLFDNTGTVMNQSISKINTAEAQRRANANRTDANGRSGMGAGGSTPGVGANTDQGIIIDGITIQVSGFIKDDATAKMIAQEVQKAVAAYDARRGVGASTGAASGSGISGNPDPTPVTPRRQ